MFRFTMNIGLDIGAIEKALDAAKIKRACLRQDLRVEHYQEAVARSHESTAVLIAVDEQPWHRIALRQRLYQLAQQLEQEAIAVCPFVRNTNMLNYEYGALIGPQAQKYGSFDQQHFLYFE